MAIWNTFQKNSFKFVYEGPGPHSIFEKVLNGKVVAGAGFEPTTFGL